MKHEEYMDIRAREVNKLNNRSDVMFNFGVCRVLENIFDAGYELGKKLRKNEQFMKER